MLAQQIKEKLLSSGISEAALNEKIKSKMEELSGLISEEGAAHIIANELGVQMTMSATVKISSLNPGLRNVETLGKIMQKYEVREFQSARGPGKVGSFLVGDETGVIRVVLWNEQAGKLATLNEGDVVKLTSGYIRDNNGRRELHLNDRSVLTVNPPGETVNVPERTRQKKQIKDLSAD